MCSEIDQFSSFLRRMSDNPQIFPVERKEGIIISETPELEERERENLENEGDHRKMQPEEIKINEDETDKATVSHKESHDKEEDGYETPTSSDHRIPPITQCPPPPMKPRPPPSRLKRKLSPSSRSIQLDSSIYFSPISNDEDDAQQQKIKRARTDDKDRS